ncbi:ClpXP protease specificity-enhancing factor [Pseudidiomarina taiwanensis]|uniref:ClpXP protease specificity-enhancing factor n=1 Tax=Pseudidiomarina taiwanensis TaxID=337250 RepID=A0A432ZKP5_9GAMM|nr:ClpXP protease specificity-enhancing factor [Pseudidiomarina taiwanensis]RUO78546.1 ClpXP protease specificity-enhancing factor [Pseudidiomarina taiwanensis]
MSELKLTPKRPYLLRALYQWMLDNQLTPHLVVNTEVAGCEVPEQFIQDGQIILNIAPAAAASLQLNDDAIHFSARFAGQSQRVWVPMAAAVALYARENGAGTIFEDEDFSAWTSTPSPEPRDEPQAKPKASHLKRIK